MATALPRALRRTAPRHARPSAGPRALGVAGLATATSVALLPSAAVAEPAPSAGEVALRVQQLDVQASLAVEEFHQAAERRAELERRAAVAAAEAAEAQARLEEARARVTGLVAAAYKRGGNDRFVALVTDGGPQAFLDRAAALDRIAQSQAEVLGAVSTASARASAQSAAASREVEALEDASAQLEARKRQVERALQAQQSLLDGLRAQERARVEAAREAAAPAPARASRTAERAAAPERPAQAAPAPARAQETYDGPASGRARTAIEEGYRHLGKPYQWGGNGPDSFDCSGFTSWVWRAAGVSLPRTSRDQYAQGRKVARADVQPGDLLFFGSPIHHVGVYVGDGQMINAPQSGGRVRVQAAFRSDYVGAVRP
ncbi:MAG TPA: NlpC/P60 family protein [Mycobacteriales bacterium]|nr:NlpC/P60 family protein [Mycobacteriales bacterium]